MECCANSELGLAAETQRRSGAGRAGGWLANTNGVVLRNYVDIRLDSGISSAGSACRALATSSAKL